MTATTWATTSGLSSRFPRNIDVQIVIQSLVVVLVVVAADGEGIVLVVVGDVGGRWRR